MPTEAPTCKTKRDSANTYLYSFTNCGIPEFKRRLLHKNLIEMMQKQESRIKWDFGDRIFVERH